MDTAACHHPSGGLATPGWGGRCGIIAIVKRLPALGCACLLTAACSQPSPTQPPVTNTGLPPPGTITGAERIGWDQEAGSADELATFQYLIYVDNVGTEAQNVSCASPASAGFACSGQLPPMSAGPHALALSAYIDSAGMRLESPRSDVLNVLVV